jgi:adenylate kinase family enzyme
MNRIAIVGKTGSGKTTLAETLAQKFRLTRIELDAIFWGPNWQALDWDSFRAEVCRQTLAERWVVEGNYRRVRDCVWGRADTLIWLDYPLGLVLKRIVVRTLTRGWAKEVLWGKNVEHWYHLIQPDSLLLHAIRTHRSHRQQYPAALQQPEYQHLKVVRLKSPKETESWLENL